jgi:2-oxoglutarate dehydrogenase E2 component (dihydrolipoamide succinyltransferase)
MAAMATPLKIPEVGESITEVEIGQWLKSEGDHVDRDEAVVVLESEKANVELPAPVSGTLVRVLKKTGETAKVGDAIAEIEEGAAKATQEPEAGAGKGSPKAKPQPGPKDAPRTARDGTSEEAEPAEPAEPEEEQTEAAALAPEDRKAEPAREAAPKTGRALEDRPEELVPMSAIRRRIGERLVAAQATAALLTTFNEIDMSEVIALRERHGEAFLALHGVKLGFMSFFVKATVDALRRIPELNAEIRGTSIAYRNYYDVGIAVGGGKGLVVPVIRNADRLSVADIEKTLAELAGRAREGSLKLEELRGGTFTISNGGVYGSLLSTPIVNPPQSGILGLHVIQDRPVAVDKQVVVRPMRYVALTYDHRIVDGSGAVTFLRRIKEVIEQPALLIFES